MNMLHIGITACSLSAFPFTPSAARRRRASFLDVWRMDEISTGSGVGRDRTARIACCGAGRGTTTIRTTFVVRIATTTTPTTGTTTTGFVFPALFLAGIRCSTDHRSVQKQSRSNPGRKAEYAIAFGAAGSRKSERRSERLFCRKGEKTL